MLTLGTIEFLLQILQQVTLTAADGPDALEESASKLAAAQRELEAVKAERT